MSGSRGSGDLSGVGRGRSVRVAVVAVTGGERPLRLAPAEAFDESGLLDTLNLGGGGGCSCSCRREVSQRLDKSAVLDDGGGDSVLDGAGVVTDFGGDPDGGVSRGLHHRADSRHGNSVGHRLGLGGGLDRGDLIGDGSRPGLKEGLGVVDDLGADPNAGVGGGLHDRVELRLGDEVGEGLLDSCGGSVGANVGGGVDCGLGLGLRCGQGVLLNLSPVDGFGRNPNASRGLKVDGGDDLRLGEVLDVGAGLRRMDRNRGRNDLCLGNMHRLGNRRLMPAVSLNIVDNGSCVASVGGRSVPSQRLTRPITVLLPSISAIQALVSTVFVGIIGHCLVEILRGGTSAVVDRWRGGLGRRDFGDAVDDDLGGSGAEERKTKDK